MQLAMAVRRHIVASGFSLLIIASQTHDTANALIGADIADISLRQCTVAVASMKDRCTGRGADAGYRAHRPRIVRGTHPISGSAAIAALVIPPVRLWALSPVAEVVLHPLYDKKDAGSHDLSLLRLAKPLPDRFVPAFVSVHRPGLGSDVIAAACGRGAEDDPKVGTILQMDVLRVLHIVDGLLTLASACAETSAGARAIPAVRCSRFRAGPRSWRSWSEPPRSKR